MTVRPIIEMADSISPCSISATIEDGKSIRQYVILRPGGGALIDNTDIVDTTNYILGGTSVGIQGTGYLKRTMPLADPVFTGWYARSVQGLKGVGRPGLMLPSAPLPDTGTLTVPGVMGYDNYLLSVEFGPRPYPVVSDDKITLLTSDPVTGLGLQWYRSDGNPYGAPLRFWQEWNRYTTYDVEPQNDYVTSQMGQMLFVRANTTQYPHAFPFTGMPRMFLPNDLVTFNFNCVPYRYVRSKNSYIRRLRGLVNQYSFWDSQGDAVAVDFPVGSLLYLTYKVTSYSPPAQTPEKWNPAITALSKLCNLQLVFLRTERYANNPPTPLNRNWVVNHHNALPWLGGCVPVGGFNVPLPGGRLFYYANMGGGAEGTPSFVSGPVPHLLFQDPDSPVAVQVPPDFF